MLLLFLLCIVLVNVSTNVNGKDVCSYFTNSSNLKLCRYRDEGLFPIDIWRYKTGAECYLYCPSQWFSNRIKISKTQQVTEEYSCTYSVGRVDNRSVTFDYQNKTSISYIFASFQSPNFFAKWEECSKNAELCCNKTMNNNNIIGDKQHCPATWDGWSCFNSAQAGTMNELPCPSYTSSSEDVPCILYSQKECFSDGAWNSQTDYSTCATAPVYRKRHNFHVIILYVSLALSFPAVCIFVSYKNLRVLRVNLHRNLLIACIIRNIFTILTKELVILDSLKPSDESNNVLEENGVACRVLAYFNSVATNAIYASMLIDGYYLHKLIVRIFNEDPNVYILYLIFIVLSFLPTTIWAIVVAVKSNNHCWVVDNAWYQWIPDGFRIAILCINVLLLLDILRALCKKLRKNVTAQETKSTLKATLFLLPLFGVPFILTANRNIVDKNSCLAGDIYYYISYSIQALQSVMVAIVFCYWNKEVHNQIRRTYRRVKLIFVERFGLKNNYVNKRRDTVATYVPNRESVAPPEEIRSNSQIREKAFVTVSDWLTGNPIGEDFQQHQNQNDYFDGIDKYIDDSIDNSGLVDNDRTNRERVSINELNHNVQFVKN